MDSIFDLDHLYRTYFKMALPSVFGLMVSVVYNLADTFFIAQSNDTALIAGVSLCAPVFTALMAFGNIYGQGGSSLISRLLGQDDREGTGRVSSFCFYVALTTGVVLAVLMMLFRVPLLGILGATAETMPYAEAYYTVLAIGAPATVLNFIHSNLVRCEGMATQSMIGSIGGTVINIILDPILITTVGWGARGAAIATIVAQVIALMWQFKLFSNKEELLHFHRGIFRLKRKIVFDSLAIGMSPFLMNLASCFIVILINQGLKRYGGDLAIGAFGIVNRLVFVFVMIVLGLNQGMQPIAGYNFGARQYPRVTQVLKLTIIGATIVTTTGFLLGVFIPELIVSIFTSDAELIRLSAEGYRIVVMFFPIVGFQMVTSNFFQSIGMAGKAIFLSLTRQMLFLVPCLLILPHFYGQTGVWVSMPASDLAASIVSGLMLWWQFRQFRKMTNG